MRGLKVRIQRAHSPSKTLPLSPPPLSIPTLPCPHPTPPHHTPPCPALQVRVLDFYSVLAPRWDLHDEGEVSHYCFSPPLWSPFWKLLTAAITRQHPANASSTPARLMRRLHAAVTLS